METSSPSERPGPHRYRVLAVEPDEGARARMTLELAGIVPSPVASISEMTRGLVEGEPTVLVFGPGLLDAAGLAEVQRITRSFPEVGVVMLAEELTMPLLQEALRAGVRDALTIDAGERQIGAAVERVGEAIANVAIRAAAAEPAKRGRIITTFSTKGGVGKSVVSTNLAVVLAARNPGRVALVDADLQFGDVAVLLGVPPLHTAADAAPVVESIDVELMDGFLATHEPSSLRVLCAPVEPATGARITAEQMVGIARLLRTMFEFVVVDMPPHFDDVVLALLEEADEVLLIASLDIPSIKNLKVGMQTLDLLSLAGGKLHLVMNRANARVHLDIADVERALGLAAEFRIPSDIAIPQAVNRGVPVVLDKPSAPGAIALRALADRYSAAAPAPVPTESATQAAPRRRGRLRER